MESLSVVIGPVSMAVGVLVLLVILAGFLWATGKLEGYDPIRSTRFFFATTLRWEFASPFTLLPWSTPCSASSTAPKANLQLLHSPCTRFWPRC